MAAKGYDDSPPRNGVIFFYSVLTVVLLFAVSILLKSYFGTMMDAEIHEKVLTRGLERAYEVRMRETEQLEKGGIGDAMRAYAMRGRTVSPLISPESGAGKAAIRGWSLLPRGEEKPTTPSMAQGAEPTKAANSSPQPANPNATEVTPVPSGGAPGPGRSPIAPANRAAPTAPAPTAPDAQR